MALPLIVEAGGDPAAYEIRGPISSALLQKCDACLRIEGESHGADHEAAWFSRNGLRVFSSVADIPTGLDAI
jgi:hypothetical protein